jgi:hypothetical protein
VTEKKITRMGTGEPLHLEGEEWRPVAVYGAYYQVSNFGRVKSLARRSYRFNPRWNCDSIISVQEKILCQSPFKYRYKGKSRIRDKRPAAMMVGLSIDGRLISRYVHHLVLEAFVGLRPQGTEACHWDGDAANNKLENLRWGTSVENKADAIRLNQFWPSQRRK